MKILNLKALRGPNIYAHFPVLRMDLDLEALADRLNTDFPGFDDRLMALLPGLGEHQCSVRTRAGLRRHLREGTSFGHIAEHVALELSCRADLPVSFGRTLDGDHPGSSRIVVEYRSERAMESLLRSAPDLIAAVLEGRSFDVDERLADARRIADRYALGPGTRAIVDAARERGIPFVGMESESLVQLGYGRYRRFLQAATTEQTSTIGVDIASNKQLTKRILDQASIPVPRGVVVCGEEELRRALQEMGFPLVVKPLLGNQGKGVTLNVRSEEEALAAFRTASQHGQEVVVEEFFTGNDYRVLVVQGKAVAAAHRIPAHVVGDGTHTVEELVAACNLDPARGEGHSRELTFIRIDKAAEELLCAQGYTPQDVPPAEKSVQLRATANLSTGGTAVDVTKIMHPAIARMCERAARLIGLDVCGIDLIAPDITRRPARGEGGIVEVNASPGLRMHLFPSQGRRRDVGKEIVDLMFPGGPSARIPIVAITGTNGKTSVTRMTAFILQHTGLRVGMTTTDGIWLGGEEIARGDLTGFKSARTVLGDPSVDVAVLETARGGIMHSGLGYDWSDVGVITNVQPDHIGQDGIASVEDLVHVKSLVAERVRPGGTVVLNLDDERAAAIAENRLVRHGKRKIVFFSIRGRHDRMVSHIRTGRTGYYREGDELFEEGPAGRTSVLRVSQLPVTGGGVLEFQVANVLAAVAAARALEVTHDQIAAALATFTNAEHNPGRGDLYRLGRGYVMLDYGHNAHAFSAAAGLRARRGGRMITGIVAVPGDRADWIIEEAGRTAARIFDRLVIREDNDLRGRESGDVAGRLLAAVRREMPGLPCEVILDWRKALSSCVNSMEDEELIVLYYDEYDAALEVLVGLQAVPIATLEGAQLGTAKGTRV